MVTVKAWNIRGSTNQYPATGELTKGLFAMKTKPMKLLAFLFSCQAANKILERAFLNFVDPAQTNSCVFLAHFDPHFWECLNNGVHGRLARGVCR